MPSSSHILLCTDVVTYPDFATLPAPLEPPHISPSCVLPAYLCALTASDPFLVSVSAWATLQLSWTLVLLATQLWQVCRQMTTLEVSNLGRYGYMGGRGGAGLHQQMGHAHQHGAGSPSEDSTGGDSGSSAASGAHVHRHKHACCGGGAGGGFLMHLLGFDRFTRGRAADGLARAARAPNPFDLGVVGNCKDFWSAGSELGVDYQRLYDVPGEGFREAKRRREEESEEGAAGGSQQGGRKSLRKSLLMGFGLGRNGARSGGYEPLSQV